MYIVELRDELPKFWNGINWTPEPEHAHEYVERKDALRTAMKLRHIVRFDLVTKIIVKAIP